MNKIKNLIIFLMILITSVIYFHKLEEHPLQDDEHAHTRRSPIVFQEYFKFNFERQFWTSFIAYDHPSLTYLIYGFVDTVVYKTSWDKLLESVRFTSHIPVMDNDYYGPGVWWTYCTYKSNPYLCIPIKFHDAYNLIVLNRYVSVTLGILTLIFVYLIGSEILGFSFGVLSFVLLALHPVFYNHTRHALLDTPFLFFELLLFYLIIKKLKNKKDNYFLNYKDTLLVSLVCGLVASTKINGFMFPVIVSIVYIFIFLNQKGKKQLKNLNDLIIHIFLIIFLSSSVFIVLNPFLLFGHGPYNNLFFMFQSRQFETQNLMSTYPQFAYPEFSQRLIMIIRNLFSNQGCCNSFKYFNLPQILNTIFSILGIVYLLKERKFVSKTLLLFFFGIFILMVFYLKLGFDRYFMPIIPFIVMIQSAGVVFLLNRVYIWFKNI